jgi:hypothetical protein
MKLNYYTYLDTEPLAGISYYRLKQTDFDGRYEYSNLIAFNITELLSTISINPNPNNGKFIIMGAEENSNLIIYNLLGETILNEKISAQNSFFDISTYPDGSYYASIQYHNKVIKRIIIINK